MEVLIISKTKYGSTQFCVGGICLDNNQFIRLLEPGGFYQPADTPFEIGDIWDITFTINDYRKEPHNEDTTVLSKEFVRRENKLETFIKNSGVNIWCGNSDILFEGMLQWTNNGSGYISKNGSIPDCSVGFWIPDRDLTKYIFYDKVRYRYGDAVNIRNMPYVGLEEAVDTIPAGTLVRVSLAKWWKKDVDEEEQCSLQLSGWYGL